LQLEKLRVEETVMTQALLADPKPYHHGDLRRALLEAAEAILEREGPSALSLRAVAREAGVSAAAPYHHFKDKNDLMLAVGRAGFEGLKAALSAAQCQTCDPADKLSRLGLAYVDFAQSHPALYQVMYGCARVEHAMPDGDDYGEGGFRLVKDAIAEASGGEMSEIDLHLAAIAAWCAAHGLAEMRGFAEFRGLKEQLGGEQAFLRGVLDHLGFGRACRR
jgi:AcrR family transcriptional regulator